MRYVGRSRTFEEAGPESACIIDFTAGAIIDGFQNDSMAKAVDRVMKQLASEKAQTILRDREPRLPSATFIKAYMDSFRSRELLVTGRSNIILTLRF